LRLGSIRARIDRRAHGGNGSAHPSPCPDPPTAPTPLDSIC